MKFKKEFFEKHKPISNQETNLDELVDVNGGEISGDYKPGYKQIQTGPAPKSFDDTSDYEKGISTTTDDWAQYANPRSWWSLYYGYGGTPYSHGKRPISETKHKIKDMLENIVDKQDLEDIVEKSDDTDMAILKRIEDLVKKTKELSTSDKEKIINIINDSNEK
jgi:hypothetical protein